MSYPQQPTYPPPPVPQQPNWVRRTLWIIAVVAAFVFGVAAGAGADSGSTSARETVTVRVPAPDAGAPAETAAAEKPPAKPAGPATTMTSGIYQVGVDVQPGQYKTAGTENGVGCYWARLTNDSGEFDAIITNGNLDGPGSVTINAGEFIEVTGDCAWTRTG